MITIDICIPFYNGFPKICGIIDCYKLVCTNLERQSLAVKLSLQIYSDGSTSDQVDHLKSYLLQSGVSNVNLIVGEVNRGMDFAFEHCVRQGSSIYAWFFGQDDLFEPVLFESLVVALIKFNPHVVYINQKINDAINKKEYVKIRNDSISSGSGIRNFMRETDYNAPYFLPSLLVKRDDFLKEIEKISIETSYAQMIAALELISHGRYLYFGVPIVSGLIPIDGWQNNINRRVEYACGYSNAVSYFYRNKLIDLFFIKSKIETAKQIILNKSTQLNKRNSLGIGEYNRIEYDLLLKFMDMIDRVGILWVFSLFAIIFKAVYRGIKRA